MSDAGAGTTAGDAAPAVAGGGAAPAVAGSAFAWYALFVLSIVTLFAFVDRTILPLVAEPIKKQLALSDLQVGLIGGTGVAIFAGLASYPLGWLSDRFDRRLVLAGCVLVWSAAVVGCGMAQDFTQLLLATAMVGAGEAGLVPIVFSMIPDLFPERRRQLANSIFAVAASAAGGLAYAISGQLVGALETHRAALPQSLQGFETWRIAFFVAAASAPLMVLLIATVRLPARRVRPAAAAADAGAPTAPTGAALLPYLRENRRTIGFFMAGIGAAVIGFGASGSWLAVILMRIYGQSAAQVGALVAPVVLVSTAASFALSIVIVRWFGPRFGARLPVRALWVSYLVAAGLAVMLLFTSSVAQFATVAAISATITAACGMLYPTALQSMAPAHLRGRVIAIQSIVSMSLGAVAAPLVGHVSDQFPNLQRGLLIAAVGVCVPALCVAALLLRLAESGMSRTADMARRIDAQEANP